MTDNLTYNQLIKRMPPKIRSRFLSLGSYVTKVVNEYQNEMRVIKKNRLHRDKIDEIKIIILMKTLGDFLEDGALAAEHALSTFQGIDIKGFTVGTTDFSQDSDGMVMGRRLFDNYKDSLGYITAHVDLIANTSWSLTYLIQSLVKRALSDE